MHFSNIIWYSLYFLAGYAVVVIIFVFKLYKNMKALEGLSPEEIEKKLNEDDWLKPHYQKYRKTFLDGQPKTKSYAEEYFTAESILQNFKFSIFHFPILITFSPKLIPGFSVGLGLLGTFIGFTEGISSFNTGSAELIMKSIDKLLGGIQTAFNTSIWGLSISLIFSFAYNWLLVSIQQKVVSITEALNAKYLIDESEYILSELRVQVRSNDSFILKPGEALKNILDKLQDQLETLKAFSTDLATQLTNFADSFTNKIGEEMVEKFNDEMYQLYNTLIDPTLNQLKEITEALRKEKSESAAAVIEKITSDLQETLQSMVNDFQRAVTGDTKAELEALTKIIQNAGASFKDLPTVVSSSLEELRFFQNEILNQMKAQTDKLHESVTIIDSFFEKEKALRDLSIQLLETSKHIETFVHPMKQSIERLQALLERSNEQDTQALETFKEYIGNIQNLAGSLDKIDTELAAVFDQLINKVQVYRNEMDESFSSNLKEYATSIERFSKQLANAAESLKDGVDELNEVLSSKLPEVV
jgi:biopolymer transport protein ExbB/TolQ